MPSVVLRVVVLCLIATVPRLAVRVRVRGLRHAPRQTAAYYAMCHRRDLDAVLPVPALTRQLGWRAAAGRLRFAQRSDSFEPGFVGRQVYAVRWAARLLHPLSVGGVVRRLGIFPLTDVRLRPAASWLRAWLSTQGDGPAGKVLTSTFLARLAEAGGEPIDRVGAQPLRHVLRWRYHRALDAVVGSEVFAGEGARLARAGAAATAHAELAALGTWLSAGGSLYTSPEGSLSPDGRIGRITAQMHRALRGSPPVTPVVPIMLTYDFMRPGRMHAAVRVAKPIASAPMLAPADLNARLHAAWRVEATFTCTQIASAWLVARAAEPFTTAELVEAVHRDAVRLRGEGRHVAPGLATVRGAQRATRGYLAWSARHGLITRADWGTWRVLPQPAMRVSEGEVGYRHFPLAYASNEYHDWTGGMR